MELRTRITAAETQQLLELGNGIISDGIRVALAMTQTMKDFWPALYQTHIRTAQALRGAKDRDRARAAAASRWNKPTATPAA